MTDADDGETIPLDAETWRWLHLRAAESYGGDIGAMAAAVLRAAMLQEAGPQDPWAMLRARANSRTVWPRYRVPVEQILEWIEAYDHQAGPHARDVLSGLRRALGVPDATL